MDRAATGRPRRTSRCDNGHRHPHTQASANSHAGVTAGRLNRGKIGEGSWFSSMDAIILEGIHDGFALHKGKSGDMYTDNPGAKKWQGFFDARRDNPGDTDIARSRWGDAEQTSTKFAHKLVGTGTEQEEVFLEYGNAWRNTLKHSTKVEGLDLCAWKWCEPAIPAFDSRSYKLVRGGASVLWKSAWLEGQAARLGL